MRKRKSDSAGPTRGTIRTTNKANRQNYKLERQKTRATNRTERVGIRADKRSNVVESKAEARETAYENGIDPNAAMWQGISSLGQSVGGAVSSVFGGGAIGSIGSAIGGAGKNGSNFGNSAPSNDFEIGGSMTANDKGESIELDANGEVVTKKSNMLYYILGGVGVAVIGILAVVFGGKKRRK